MCVKFSKFDHGVRLSHPSEPPSLACPKRSVASDGGGEGWPIPLVGLSIVSFSGSILPRSPCDPEVIQLDIVETWFRKQPQHVAQIVAVNTPLSDKISRQTLKPFDKKQLLDLCERIRTRVAKETKQRVEIISCYEAG